jgi:hypothetical protein
LESSTFRKSITELSPNLTELGVVRVALLVKRYLGLREIRLELSSGSLGFLCIGVDRALRKGIIELVPNHAGAC